jgi:uncharacterized membrane protein YoaK (UPF0700 family)
MRSGFHRYGFALGLILGVVIGVFTGSIALWVSIGLMLGIVISRARFGHKLPQNKVEILPPEANYPRRGRQ